MQTIENKTAFDMQAAYPECIKESKSSNRIQALLWLIVAVVLFVIYHQQPDKDTPLSSIQVTLIALSAIWAVYKFFFSNSRLTYIPTGCIVKKEDFYFNIGKETNILRCLEEGDTARLKALKSDSAGGLLVELIESQDHLFAAARLFKYEPHGYIAKTDWTTMKQ